LFVGRRKAEKHFNGAQGVSEMPFYLTKATLLKRKAGVSGMRLDEVADHPIFGRDSGKCIWSGKKRGKPNAN
jgi:hypothetical protein